MEVALFLTFRTPPCAGPAPLDEVAIRLNNVDGLRRALMHTPSSANDPYLKDEDAPPLALQLYFDNLAALEAAAAPDGALQSLAERRAFPWIRDAHLSQQAMVVRRFPVAAPADASRSTPHCTYLVAYEGAPRDYSAWLGHYLTSHIPLMQRMPGIRELEVYTCLDWISALPAQRDNAVQRNKVVFDDNGALSAALQSPIRHEMRRDFEASPPFDGHNVHFPMTSHTVPLNSARPHSPEVNS